MLAGGGIKTFKVVGLATPSGSTAISLGGAAYLVLPAAESVFSTNSTIDQVQMIVKEGFKNDEVKAELAKILPLGVSVQTPRTRSQMAEETMFATENGLRMSIAFAVLISAFIIYNTFQMSVGERRRQLGILRAIGATKAQVGWMILREALVISILAAALGCLLGVYGANMLSNATERMSQVNLPGATITWQPFAIAVLIGILVSVVGAVLPAPVQVRFTRSKPFALLKLRITRRLLPRHVRSVCCVRARHRDSHSSRNRLPAARRRRRCTSCHSSFVCAHYPVDSWIDF